jgi:hypothetical protein
MSRRGALTAAGSTRRRRLSEMSDLSDVKSFAIDPARVALVERQMLALPQVECPVVHHFGPGVAIREVFMPAGTFAIGHRQRFEHMNIMLRGRVLMLQDDGGVRELCAPMLFVGKPGRKIGYVVEDMVWQNVYATELRDAAAIEDHFLEKSEGWVASESERMTLEALRCQVDRVDFLRALEEFGFDPAVVRAQSECLDDQCQLPAGSYKMMISASPIEGRGVFVTAPVEPGEVIAPARVGGKRTPVGRYTNHSRVPNAVMVLREGGDIDLVATRRIDGCRGGGSSEEVTIDYRQALALSGLRAREQA